MQTLSSFNLRRQVSQVTINYTYERGSTQAVVLGLTAAKLVESRTSQIEGWEQVSTLPVGDATVTVYWSLRETPDDRGEACALPWDQRSDADHVFIHHLSVTGTTTPVDESLYLTHSSSLRFS
mgnify:CR=1 FL=1